MTGTRKYDFVIIGSGLGGLVSAIILAKEGYSVCVLEKNNQFGGNLQTFVRDKTIFDTGIHYIGGLAEGENLNSYFKYIGIMDGLNLKKMDEDGYDMITFDDDPNQYPHAQGYANFVAQLAKHFPEEEENLKEYCGMLIKVCESFPLYNLNHSAEGYDSSLLSINAKEYIDSVTQNEKLRAVLAGSNFLYAGIGDKSPLYVHALSVNSYIQSAWRCINGGSQITKQLIKQLKKHGGETHKYKEVTGFGFEGDALVSAKTKDGDEFFAGAFISNIELKTTLKMVGEDKFRKAFYNRVQDLEVVGSAFSLYLVFKPDTFPYINHNYYHFKDSNRVWQAMECTSDSWPEGYMMSMNVSGRQGEWAESMTIITFMDFEEVRQWAHTRNTTAEKEDRGGAYERFKEEKAEKLLKEIEKKFPGIRSCIKSMHTSTPLSYRDYIGGQNGNLYGYVKDSNNPMKTFVPTRAKLPNLYFTGQSINMHGVLGVTIGAVVTCADILGKDYLINKINSELRKLSLLLLVLFSLLLASCGTYDSLHHKPVTDGYNTAIPVTEKINDTTFTSGKNSLAKNRQGQWELYIEGDPLQRGLVNGALTQPLIHKQEHAFLGRVQELVPSKFRQSLLRQFLKWYNRKLYLHVPEEYKTEIYGISQYASARYNNIAPPYLRALYLHAAHDIGHALNDLALVGCTSFAAWGSKTYDGSLLIARNLDFYAGDEFAEDKIVAFVKPDSGYPYMSVVWGGFIGNLSGMNLEGLTVTINAGKSDMPLIAKTPISLLSREILQYASNIDEAIAIAKKREVFVSESIMIGSANDKRAVLIEVSPEKFGVYDVPNTTQLVCSNHFQSETYKDDRNNTETMRDSHSEYRYNRMEELLYQNERIDTEKAAEIMRNREGILSESIGYGNELAINQLLAHHTIIFKPEEKLVWVSSNPYNLGAFTAYDLNEVFSAEKQTAALSSMQVVPMLIAEDEFKYSQEFKDYEEFRRQDRMIDLAITKKENLPAGFIETYQKLNPSHWKVYYSAGLYFYNKGYMAAAGEQFREALTKEITTLPARRNIEAYLEKINRKID